MNPFAHAFEAAFEATFDALAQLRAGRVFHPRGATFTGTLTIDASDSPIARALGAGSHLVTVRVSKALGTPETWPDVRGLALRLAADDIGPVDLLFATVARRFPYVLMSTADWDSHPYSSLIPYETEEGKALLRLEPAQPTRARGGSVSSIATEVVRSPLTFELLQSTAWTWQPIGLLTLADRSDAEIAFDPVVNQHPRLRHLAALTELRALAYRGSRRGRDAIEPGLVPGATGA